MVQQYGLTSPCSASGRYYCLEEKIGEGASGIVYKAHELASPDVKVALKRPRKNSREVEIILSAQSRTLREAGFLQLLKHPHVVGYIDHGCGPEFPYVVMEYVQATLARGKASQEAIENYIEQMPLILKVLQENNVAHCDLRPANIGYASETLKLLDFGLAVPFEHNFFHFNLPLQPHHPPELRRAQVVTKTTDTYSAGKILEYLVLGEYHHSATAAIAKMKRIYGAAPPKSFQRLLGSMVRQQPFRRPNPRQLEELANDTLRDLSQKEYFSAGANISLADAPIDFFGSNSSPRASSS